MIIEKINKMSEVKQQNCQREEGKVSNKGEP